MPKSVPVSPRKKKLQALDRKILHDLRNEGMKVFGQYFTFFISDMGATPDAANELALRQVATIMEDIAATFASKADYIKE